MKELFSIISVFLISVLSAQAPEIEWQKSLGGSLDDYAYSIQQTSDGGYIVAGMSRSNDGDVSGHHHNGTNYDYWIVKLEATGNIQWQKSLGGRLEDGAYSIQQTSDGGYIVAGSSNSNNGDVSGVHSVQYGYPDYWVVKLNSLGDIEWQKALGGSSGDVAYSIQQTSDDGYIVAGSSTSSDGNVSSNHGGIDAWLVKLNSLGSIQWEKPLGGSGWDYAKSIKQTSDGGYIVAGASWSNDGDVSSNQGYSDVWIVKLDTLGSIQWQKSLGGSGEDIAESIQQTSDGGYIVAGSSWSNDGDVSGNHGSTDYWVVKLNSLGSMEWQKSLGGSSNEQAYSIQQTSDGGYIVAGESQSNDGDVSGHQGHSDVWVIKLNSTGSIQWQKSLGGSGLDIAYSIRQAFDGGYIMAGISKSNDGDVSGNHGGIDFWVVKLAPDVPATYTITTVSNPAVGGSTSGGGTYEEGSTATVTATPNEGYVFWKWMENGVKVSTDASYSFTVTSDRNLVARFKPDSVSTPTYSVTTSSNPAIGGSTSGDGTYEEGSTAMVTAIPNTGYVFQKWMENGVKVSTNASYSFTVNSDRNLVARFKPDGTSTPTYVIKVAPKPATGGIATGAGTYESGTLITLKATANTGYVFKNWTEGGIEVSAKKNFKFTVTGNRNLKANFEKLTYTINTVSAPVAGGTTSGGGNYLYGKQITVKAIAAPGFVFKNWTEGSTEVSTNKNYKFTVTSNRKLKANFEKATYTINTVSAPAAGGTTSGGGNYISGKQITVKAVAATGYVFSEWLEGGVSVSTNKNYKFTVTGNRTLKAKFVKASNSVQYARTDAGAGKEMKIYPNPFNDYLYINTGDSVPQKALLYDLSGKQIGDYTLGKEPVVRIDTKSITKGTYVLRVYTESSVKTFKVVKK